MDGLYVDKMKSHCTLLAGLFVTVFASARTFTQNPAHPGWQMDTHFLKDATVYLRYGGANPHTKKVSTEFVAKGGDPAEISPWHSDFVGRHTVMAYLGEETGNSLIGRHRLLFGWRFHPHYKEPKRYADEFVIVEFHPTDPEKAQEEWSAGFDDAVTFLEALIYQPEKLDTPEIKKIEKELKIKIHRCKSDYAKVTLGASISLEAVHKEIVEQARDGDAE